VAPGGAKKGAPHSHSTEVLPIPIQGYEEARLNVFLIALPWSVFRLGSFLWKRLSIILITSYSIKIPLRCNSKQYKSQKLNQQIIDSEKQKAFIPFEKDK
jgi:hypothetical protein